MRVGTKIRPHLALEPLGFGDLVVIGRSESRRRITWQADKLGNVSSLAPAVGRCREDSKEIGTVIVVQECLEYLILSDGRTGEAVSQESVNLSRPLDIFVVFIALAQGLELVKTRHQHVRVAQIQISMELGELLISAGDCRRDLASEDDIEFKEMRR